MTMFPTEITIREVGPREGVQTGQAVVTAEQAAKLVRSLANSGLSEIEVASFVRNDRVPSMNIADEVCRNLVPVPGVRFSALCLNQKGYERTTAFPVLSVGGWIHTAASDAFLSANMNSSFEKILLKVPELLQYFKQSQSIPLEGVMFSTTFGYQKNNDVTIADVIKKIKQLVIAIQQCGVAPPRFVLADTSGVANPKSISDLVTEIRSDATLEKILLGLHLHDTRGLGLANAYQGLALGIDYFDSSIAGVGGCPFLPGAAGNIATEELVYLADGLGIKTGVNVDRILTSAKIASELFSPYVSSRLLTSVSGSH